MAAIAHAGHVAVKITFVLFTIVKTFLPYDDPNSSGTMGMIPWGHHVPVYSPDEPGSIKSACPQPALGRRCAWIEYTLAHQIHINVTEKSGQDL